VLFFFLLSVIQHKIKRILFAVEAAPALEGAGGWVEGKGICILGFCHSTKYCTEKENSDLVVSY